MFCLLGYPKGIELYLAHSQLSVKVCWWVSEFPVLFLLEQSVYWPCCAGAALRSLSSRDCLQWLLACSPWSTHHPSTPTPSSPPGCSSHSSCLRIKSVPPGGPCHCTLVLLHGSTYCSWQLHTFVSGLKPVFPSLMKLGARPPLFWSPLYKTAPNQAGHKVAVE